MIKHFAPYDQVADEYYDGILHPTCANFRQLAQRFMEKLLDDGRFKDKFRNGHLLETGAGFSLAAELMSQYSFSLENLTIQDASEKMLQHSFRWQNSLADIYVSDARQLQAADATYDIVFSFLCDPYNDPRLWREITRVLKEDGLWVMTSPSHHWAKHFRLDEGETSSRFVTRDQRTVDLPSFTYPVSDVVSGVEAMGCHLRAYNSLTISEIEGNVSKKLFTKGSGGSVLDCFVFEKTVN